MNETEQMCRNGASGGEACRCVQTLVRWDDQPGLRNLSVSGRWQTRSHKQSWSENCRAASTACRVCQSRQIRAGRVRACRGICGSSPHGSSLWEGAGDEAHLHTDSLPQPHGAPATLIDDWGRMVVFFKAASPLADSVRWFWRKSHTIPRRATSSALLQGRSHLGLDPECTVGAARLSWNVTTADPVTAKHKHTHQFTAN